MFNGEEKRGFLPRGLTMKIKAVYIFFSINIPYLTEHFIGAIETKFLLPKLNC